MNALAGIVQVAGVALAPLLPGSIQTLKARLQGRRGAVGAAALQDVVAPVAQERRRPRGDRRRLPARAAARRGVPARGAGHRPGGRARRADFGLGNDALVLVGLLALARFALAAAAWDTGNGFALMAAARDLTISVFGEALLVLALLLAALPAAQHRPERDERGGGRRSRLDAPAHWCGALAFVLVMLVETGRQPIDNPDTHLELTMIHEGPLLEYAGRDLALLQWAAAARHWIVLVLGAELFLPHRGAVCGAPRAPRRRGGLPLRLARRDRDDAGEDADPARPGAPGSRMRDRARGRGHVGRRGGHVNGALVDAMLALGLAVIVVRRRSVAIVLLAAQSLALGVGALSLAGGRSGGSLVAELRAPEQGDRAPAAPVRADSPHARAGPRARRREPARAPGVRRRGGAVRRHLACQRSGLAMRTPSTRRLRWSCSASRSSSRGARSCSRCSG